MNIYLDDNITDGAVAGMLRAARHSVVRPADAALSGASDARHLEYAVRMRFVVVTKDTGDFTDLHLLAITLGGRHFGILFVHYDNDAARDMKPKHIVRAIGRLEQSGLPLENQIYVLNHWR